MNFFILDLKAIHGAKKLQHSNPSVFSILPLYASLRIFSETNMHALSAKAASLRHYLDALLETLPASVARQCKPITPSAQESSVPLGAQLSLACHGTTLTLCQLVDAFLHRGIYVDAREPCIIRIAPTPLYNTYTDILNFFNALKDILA
jgi:kynureninase